MQKWFNTAGPCQADIHYMLSATERLPAFVGLIAQRNYFVIHAPRQTGKSTAMIDLAKELTESGQYIAVMLSVEVGAAFPHDPQLAQNSIWGQRTKRNKLYAKPVFTAVSGLEAMSTILRAVEH